VIDTDHTDKPDVKANSNAVDEVIKAQGGGGTKKEVVLGSPWGPETTTRPQPEVAGVLSFLERRDALAQRKKLNREPLLDSACSRVSSLFASSISFFVRSAIARTPARVIELRHAGLVTLDHGVADAVLEQHHDLLARDAVAAARRQVALDRVPPGSLRYAKPLGDSPSPHLATGLPEPPQYTPAISTSFRAEVRLVLSVGAERASPRYLSCPARYALSPSLRVAASCASLPFFRVISSNFAALLWASIMPLTSATPA